MPIPVTFLVTFPELDLAEANRAAGQLRETLLGRCGPQDRINIRRASDATQDAGSILEIMLAAPAIIEVARGIRDFIAARGNSIEIRTANGVVVGRGTAATNIDAAAVSKALTAYALTSE